jgi:hypothetical protein
MQMPLPDGGTSHFRHFAANLQQQLQASLLLSGQNSNRDRTAFAARCIRAGHAACCCGDMQTNLPSAGQMGRTSLLTTMR